MHVRSALALLVLLTACPALAASKHHAKEPAKEKEAAPPGATRLGKFQDWTAVKRQENGQTVCFAFAYPSNSVPKLAGRGRPVLTVTERPTGRDAVAFGAGFAFQGEPETTLQVDQAGHPFYTSGRFAFARDGAAAVAAMRKGLQATMRSPGPRNAQITDTFSLRGFEQAYTAITKACPPQ